MIMKKLFGVTILCLLSFVAGSYYTIKAPSTSLNSWNKSSVELFASTPETLNSAFEDLKIVLTSSMNFIDHQLENLLSQNKGDSNQIENKQTNYDNPLKKPTDDIQQIDVDHEEKDTMPSSSGPNA